MLANEFNVAVANSGAVLSAVRPWSNPSGTAVNYALGQFPLPAVGTPSTRLAASWRTAAMVQPVAVTATGLPIDTRKQIVHKTRVNAGGDGASGPHPEREPA